MITPQEKAAKLAWLRPTMNGTDDDVIQSLLNTLPLSDSLDADGLKALSLARVQMSELFSRGITCNRFCQETGLTGFVIDPPQDGVPKFVPFSGYPNYFRLWLSGKDPVVTAQALKNILVARRDQMQLEYRSKFKLLIFIDVDCERCKYPSPLEAGLTPHAVCFDVNLVDVGSLSEKIDAACLKVSKLAQNQVRFGIGKFGPNEYADMGRLSLFTHGMPFGMGSEWILFKNIQRRAGRFGALWRLAARVFNRFDKLS